MGTLRHISDYILPPIVDGLDEQKKNRVKLCNQRLVVESDGFFTHEPDETERSYPDVIFIDDVFDEETGYTMAYNAKVGTVMPILESGYTRYKNEWIPCDGSTYFKEDYPMLFNKIKNIFYEENAIGDEIPLYINEFQLPLLKPRKLNSNSDEKVIWIIKATRREQGNHYDIMDDLT